MTIIGYRYRFYKDAKSEWMYERELNDVPLRILLDFKDADETLVQTLAQIFTKCKDSKLAASICKQRRIGPGCIDAKSTRMILELLELELKSPRHIPELGNFEIEEVEVKIADCLAKRIVFDFCFASRGRNDETAYVVDLTCLDSPDKLGYLEKLDPTSLKDIKVISAPKTAKACDFVF